ncbi:hypothetical protein COLO4_31274 [Corchorus olitorius]|uniref:Uncharacterized protein n=1 Tax=Corchorus olitorius TaxID=93759 RepID=A0A1R3H509_9ROSI|nr:hypothetical protein COLO4_31274 [Corchorus olitorius]
MTQPQGHSSRRHAWQCTMKKSMPLFAKCQYLSLIPLVSAKPSIAVVSRQLH